MSLKIYRAAVQNGRAQSGDVCETYEREEVLRDARPQIARSFFVYTDVFFSSFLSFFFPTISLPRSLIRERMQRARTLDNTGEELLIFDEECFFFFFF